MTEFDLRKLVPPHVAALDGYHAKEPVPFSSDVLKMDLNECLTPPSPRVLEALRNALAGESALNWYPDSSSAELRRAIGRYLGVSADYVLVTSGSNMAIELIGRAFLVEDDSVMIASPVYAVFELQCKLQQARIEHFHFSEPFAPQFAELLEKSGTFKAFYLANPNNPTGAGHRREDILALLQRHPQSLIVLDEAYNEFYGVSCVDLVARFPNLLVLRSFSKAFSLAGMRCGYVVAQPEVLEILARVMAPWAVNALTQAAAVAALEDVEHMRSFVAECAQARQLIVDGLTNFGFVARNAPTNFVLWQVNDPKKVTATLAARQIFVSNKDAVPQMKGYLRLTVGTQTQARQFLAAVKELCAEFLA